MDDRTLHAFVTGWPIEQSLSPVIHGYWLEKHGLEGSYKKHGCPPEDFSSFLGSLSQHGYVGGNVTIPHKESAFDLVQERTPIARHLGAVNTVWLQDGKLWGDNTDGYGFLANLDEAASGWDAPDRLERGALILGAGGAARAIIYALQQRGFKTIWIANRTVERAQNLAEEFGLPSKAISMEKIVGEVENAGVVVNTTSVGMGDGKSPLNLAFFSEDTVVNDIVYKPLITPLLEQAKQLSMQPVDGLGMLMHQAVPGFERWFGLRPQVTQDLKDLLLARMAEAQ